MKKISLDIQCLAKLNAIVSRYKSYSSFSRNKSDAYKYVDIIGIKVCPYCNINYIYSVYRLQKVTKLPVSRADLDHFEAKSITSKKSLDVLNLVPSCQQCNSRLKHKTRFSIKTHLHPFLDDFDSVVSFSVKLVGTSYINEAAIEIIFTKLDSSNWSRATRNISDFALIERYQHHKDEVLRIFKAISFVNLYRLNEVSSLAGIGGITKAMLMDYSDCEINSNSLGKLKRDIVRRYL